MSFVANTRLSSMNLAIISITLAILILKYRSTDAVFNGKIANIGDFPYMAALCYNQEVFCGGAIIGERHYLTAGHCLYGRTEANHYIMAGATHLLDPRGIYFPVKYFYMHPNYYDGEYGADLERGGGPPLIVPMKHDIAIIEIWNEFPLKLPVHNLPDESMLYDLYEPVTAIDKIPWATEFVGQCIPCVFAGWGGISRSFVDVTAFALSYITLFINHCEACIEQNCQGDPYTFCTHDWANTATPGRGDSGGPLVCNGVIAGVYSVSYFDPHYPARFTNVVLYKDWIESIVPSLTEL